MLNKLMMNTIDILRATSGGVLMLAAIAMNVGCVDLQGHVGPSEVSIDQAGDNVRVIPEFNIVGLDSLPDDLHLDTLYLSIAEIRLEPLVSRPSDVAYTTRQPLHLAFDMATGETTQVGEAFEFRKSGRFLVSLRLEPLSREDSPYYMNSLDENGAPSLSITGHVTTPLSLASGTTYNNGNNHDGNPLPLPFDEQADGTPPNNGKLDGFLYQNRPTPEYWTPFYYSSHRAVFYTFSDVELTEGEQFLSFTVDVRDWASDLLNPIKYAVRHRGSGQPDNNDEGVDITGTLDSSGYGAESLMQRTTVTTERSGPGGVPSDPNHRL